MAVEEGDSAKISSIRFVGNKAFTEKQLLDEMRLTTPTWPCLWMWPGMMPILARLGLMMPGQLGPMRRLLG